jgi:hypothetical protein
MHSYVAAWIFGVSCTCMCCAAAADVPMCQHQSACMHLMMRPAAVFLCAVWQREASSSKGCAVELHTPARVLQHNVVVVAQTAEAASRQGLNAQIARMQTFHVAYHAYERVRPTRLTPVLSDSAALQQYDLRRPRYRATRRHSAVNA